MDRQNLLAYPITQLQGSPQYYHLKNTASLDYSKSGSYISLVDTFQVMDISYGQQVTNLSGGVDILRQERIFICLFVGSE